MSKVQIYPASVEYAQDMIDAMVMADLQNFFFFAGKTNKPTLEEQREYIRNCIDNYEERLFIIDHNSRLVGTCGLHNIDWHCKNARVGVMLFSNEFRGQGLGSAAIRALLDLAFGDKYMGLHKAYINVLAENQTGCIKDLHLGFRFEGCLHEHYLLNGEYKDMVQMRLFAHEWRQMRKG